MVAVPASARTESEQATLDRGDFEEFNFRMDAGWNVTYNWSATGAVYFDIHSHQGAQVTHHVRNESTTGVNGTFDAPKRQLYSVFWENRGDDAVDLDWRLDGRFLDETEQFPDHEPAPGVGVAVAAVVLAGIALHRR